MNRLSVIVALSAASLGAAPTQEAAKSCWALHDRGKLTEAQTCFAKLLRSPDPFESAEGHFGLGQYENANAQFRSAVKAGESPAIVKTEWGRLFLERYQPADAAQLFSEALQADPKYAPAYLGLARIAGEGFDEKAVELARKALDYDPKLAEAHEFLAYLALEDNDRKTAATEVQKALDLSSDALEGMSVLASADWLDGKSDSDWMNRILAINPVYGEAYVTGAHFFEINYRYEDAIEYERKALSLNPSLWPARSELGVNLMRLGRDEEARQELTKCYAAHYRDAKTVNSLKLLDTLPQYQTFRSGKAEVLLNKKEASLLQPYIQPELERAIEFYQAKYKMKLPGPVRLEVYPNHDDFVVRTLGLPGQGGLLGVTFNLVVAMDSPSSRPPGDINWGSTMWHELSHVYVLTASHHLVPRWFAEGIAVHEQGAIAPDWGNRLTPDIVAALGKHRLLRVVDLDRGFVRPQFPGQVLVSYFQAGKICDFITQKWGDDAVLAMIHSYGTRKTTAEVIQEVLHKTPESFDKDFDAWLTGQTANTVAHFDQWKEQLKAAHANLAAGKLDDVIHQGPTIVGEYPDYVGEGSEYDVLAQAHLKKNDKVAAETVLTQYRDRGGSDVELLKSLARLQDENGKTKDAELTLIKLTFIYPEDAEMHRMLARLALRSGDSMCAVRESQAVVSLNPSDPASSHYELAEALRAANRLGDAKEQVVQSLEAAPDFKPAQRLLLQLSH